MPYPFNSFASGSRQPQRPHQHDRTCASEDGSTSQRRDEVILEPTLQSQSSIEPVSSPTAQSPPEFLWPQSNPLSSRPATPLPSYYSSNGLSSSTYTSDADSEPSSPLLGTGARRVTFSSSWWSLGHRSHRRRRRSSRDNGLGFRTVKRQLRRLVRHPCFPRQPTSILLCLLIFTVIAIIVTLLLMHILNPDKVALPWRTYCSLPRTSIYPPSLTLSSTDETFTVQLPIGVDPVSLNGSIMSNSFPPANLDEIPPVGILLAVFSVDSAIERRMLIRSTWASHKYSRVGAGVGDGGNGTSRTIVRFVLGKARSDWERRIQLESEIYNDIIRLPISENMNSGKTHAFFTWAAENAWVPPASQPQFYPHVLSYSNYSAPPPPRLAPHDPMPDLTAVSQDWVRPDFVAKSDDDSFVMLAELESRLRVQFQAAMNGSKRTTHSISEALNFPSHSHGNAISSGSPDHLVDPLIYWGYLVKNRFMAGELYSLSWSLISWVASEPTIKTMTRGAEDKQTAKWMRLHPRAEDIRWASDRCWIYDHPRAGTVYSHGFLFPSEARRVRKSMLSLLKPVTDIFSSPDGSTPQTKAGSFAWPIDSGNDTITYSLPSPLLPTTPSYSYSSVSQFGTHYTFPLATLTVQESVEALVEGSEMSGLFEGGPETASQAWARREGRQTRYEGNRVGGTMVVHFIKRNEWFMETALALLGGDEIVASEREMGKGVDAFRVASGTSANSTHLTMIPRR